MRAETDFLRKLLENPADDATRLVYADWLDEHGDPLSSAKSQFLRLTARPDAEEVELQRLASQFDSDWLAVVSRLKVENCAAARAKQDANLLWEKFGIRFNVVCDRRWEDLAATDDNAVRFCDDCKQHVHYCDTIEAARRHAWKGECVAVNLGVIRQERDLEQPVMMVGAAGII
ncbi:MAG TPA: TIGR02996 domain-containing protein [Gemmata sp.]|nr:TIGR02996 domain-containing protein [Gemmata sp.]